ncbi:hypothetical protein MRB53_023833 [Persea americana]|uniref:Uncharacterized protein n=1 Tax=Persea americana TaxID=3435 RepID=A0ACC2LAN8_PERAE|nr:hypothetical protein MRB53_023833 [Persea americana]
MEDEEGIPYDDIVRVRVVLNIKEYLIPAIWLTDEERWIYIKYEKVNAICRFCGMVDHGEDDCANPYPLSEVPQDYSEWTRLKIPSLQEGRITTLLENGCYVVNSRGSTSRNGATSETMNRERKKTPLSLKTQEQTSQLSMVDRVW